MPNRRILEIEQKALEINLDERFYGAFAEIGAGQEVARYFFQVGAAAGTVAKTMSAYDKTVSDDIYGPEDKGRYVCEARLYKMLNHEYRLMESRLRRERPGQNFFVFANTVAAINFQRTIKGAGWLGVRFQTRPDAPPNDVVLHARLLDPNNRLQQQAVGILGVNLIYACLRYSAEPRAFLSSLMDNLRGRVMIDMLRFTGPDFETLDNRLICLWMVELGLSDVAIFGPDHKSLQAGEFLYKKNILICRGSYRPPTLVQQDMIRSAHAQFSAELGAEADRIVFLTEITLDNLCADSDLNERDFLDRADILCAMGHIQIVSNCLQHKRLIAYFNDYKTPRIGLVMGARKLQIILRETCENNPDNLLGAFGELFPRNVRFYVYPARKSDNTLLHTQSVEMPPNIRDLYKHLLENGHIKDLEDYNPNILHIYHKDALRMIQKGQAGWQAMTSPQVGELIMRNGHFGYRSEPFEGI